MNRSQAKSDLLWAINSPNLLNSRVVGPLLECSLNEAEIDEQRLSDFLSHHPNKSVGRYFERLIEYYLRHIAGFELIANQQQIQKGAETIGEIDFLYRDHMGLLTHLEVAIKFYLHWPESMVNGSHYLGSNINDTLERKVNQLFEHQLPLSRRLSKTVDVRQAMVKGTILSPLPSADLSSPVTHDNDLILANDHGRGYWIHVGQIETLTAQHNRQFIVLEKPHWLTPDHSSNLYDFDEFRTRVSQHFLNSHRPIHAWMVSDMGRADRLFVVSPSWPKFSGTES